VTAATALATIYDPDGAVDAGYLDAVTDPDSVIDDAKARAAVLASTLSPRAFRATRVTVRGTVAAAIERELDADLSGFFVDS
jgi:enoyl-CoA hydratase/carnithine racemase